MTRGTRDETGTTVGAREGGGPAVTTDGLPGWLDPVVEAARSVQPGQLSRFLPPEDGRGRSPPCSSSSGRAPAAPSCS